MRESDAAIEVKLQAKGSPFPRLTPQDIEAAIVSEHFFTAHDGVVGQLVSDGASPGEASYNGIAAIPAPLGLLTFCVMVLRNGFTVTGESYCASPENFDAQIGREVARDEALQKIWPLEGYLLRARLADEAVPNEGPSEEVS